MTPEPGRYRVLLIVRWPLGGIRTFLRYVYRGFEPERWDITLIAPDHPELDVLLREDLAALRIRHVSAGPEPGATTLLLRAAALLRRERFDFVHSHGFTAGLSAALPVAMSGTYHLLTSHDVINRDQFEGFSGRLKHALSGIAFGRFQKIHSVSHDAQANLLESFPMLDRDRCSVICNGIEVERFLDPQPRDFRAELDLGPDVFLIGFLGRFMAQKGFRYLVDAVEILSRRDDLPRRPLVLAFGEGGFLRQEKEAIERRGLTDSFRFLPFASNVAESIRGFDVVAMPSLWEACGLLAMETLVTGSPLICTDCIGLREVVADSPAIQVRPRDGAGLAEALAARMRDNDRTPFERFSATAARRYDVREQIAGIEALYREILTVTGRANAFAGKPVA